MILPFEYDIFKETGVLKLVSGILPNYDINNDIKVDFVFIFLKGLQYGIKGTNS